MAASTPTRIMSRTLVSGLWLVLLLLLLVALFLGALSGPAMADDQVLYADNSLFTGQSLRQGNYYALTMRSDCNLVLSDAGITVWETRTNGSGSGCYVTMQTDGNLVVWTNQGRVAWASGTARGDGNYALVLQRVGKLVIYGPSVIWTAGGSTGGVGGLKLKAAPGGAPAGEGGNN